MPPFQEFLLIAIAHFLALLSPGPDFLLILSISARHGSAAGIRASAGIATANGVYILIAIAGLGALSAQPGLLAGLRWGGCAYLAWLGWRLLRAGPASQLKVPPAGLSSARVAAFRAGLASGLLNPKNILFYFSLFSMGAGQKSLLVRSGYGLWMFGIVFLWDGWLARTLGRGRLHVWLHGRQQKLERSCGALFLLLACALAGGGNALS